MMIGLFVRSTNSIRYWPTLAAVFLLVAWGARGVAQDGGGCEGVGYAKQGFKEYSPDILQKRLERNPSDVDALVNLGIHLEEQGETGRADDLYVRAIRAKPDCYLGYYFAGLAEDGISRHIASEAEAKIHRALSLDPSLRSDPNVEGFLRRHSKSAAPAPPKPATLPPTASGWLASANRFLIGVGVGFLLAAPLLYLTRRKVTESA